MDIPEILAEILSYCVDLVDYANWSLVCNQWRYFVSCEVEVFCRKQYAVPIDSNTLSQFPNDVNPWMHIFKCLFRSKFLVCYNKYVDGSSIQLGLKKLGIRNVDVFRQEMLKNKEDKDELRTRLTGYDAIVFSTNNVWIKHRDLWGDVFKELIDDGVGVIQLVFSICSGSENLGGAWEKAGVSAIVPRIFEEKTGYSEGAPTQRYHSLKIENKVSDHFIFNGTDDLTHMAGYKSTGTPHPEGKVLATFEELKEEDHILPCIVELDKFKGKSMAINCYASTASSQEGSKLIANSLLYCAKTSSSS